MSVKINDNSAKFLEDFERKLLVGLEAIGIEAEGNAKEDANMPVDTGRARNSITWATKAKEGEGFSYSDDKGNNFNDQIGTGADEHSVYIGSNVEYFPYIEEGSRTISARHVLRNAIVKHKDEYLEMLRDAFKNL
jgi:hypothetical protein